MATSIEQSLNWRNVSTKPDYQVAARRVDTFVQPERDTRGTQIAKALDQAAGGFNTFANKKKVELKALQVAQAKAQTKAVEEITDREKMKASNLANFWSPQIERFVQEHDYSLVEGERPTRESIWEALNTKFPALATDMNNLTTLKGKIALGDVTGDIFGKTVGDMLVQTEIDEEEQELNTYIATRLGNIPMSPNGELGDAYINAVKTFDQEIRDKGRTNIEAYTSLGNTASIIANQQGDFRLYDYLISTDIGGTDQKKAWIKEREAIKSKRAQQRNQRNTEVADKLKADKVLLAQEGAALFNTDAPVTSEQEIALIQKYIEQGVPNADSLVKTMSGNYRAIQKVVMTPEQESRIWQGFIAAGTPDNQRNFIQVQVNKKVISQGLATQLYSRLGNSNDKFLLQDVVYQQYFKGVETLSKKSTGFMGALENNIDYAYIRPLFQKKYLEMATAPDWKDKDPDVELANLFNSMRQLREINQSDFLSDGKTVNNQNDAQQLSELMNPETPEEIEKKAARRAAAQDRIAALRKAQATQ
tara:strand:- start:3958 stop:5556 length:1599 start_codon:yes stop_codon:yes gene_type:complete